MLGSKRVGRTEGKDGLEVHSAERECLERMCDLIGGSEELLVGTVTEAVEEHGVEHMPRSVEAWRESVRGLSDAIFQAVYAHLELDGPRNDPVLAYGIVRGRVQNGRGVRPEDWTALIAHYRRAYLDLIASAGCPPEESCACRDFLERVFDRLENGFALGCEPCSKGGRAAEG